MYGWQQWGAGYGGMQGGGQMNSYGAGPMQANGDGVGFNQVWQNPTNQMYPNATVGQYQQSQQSYGNQPAWQQRYQQNFVGGVGMRKEQLPPAQTGIQQQQRNADNTALEIPVSETPLPPLPQGSPPTSAKKTAEPTVDASELNPKDSKEQERLDQLKQQAQQWQAQQQQWQHFQEQQQQTYQQQMSYQHMNYHQPLQHPYLPQQQGFMQPPVFDSTPQQQQLCPQQKPQQVAQMQPQAAAFAPRPNLPQPQTHGPDKPGAKAVSISSGPFIQQQKSTMKDFTASTATNKPSETSSSVPMTAPKLPMTAPKLPMEKVVQAQVAQKPQQKAASGSEKSQNLPGETIAPQSAINPQVQAALDEFERQLKAWNEQFETWRGQNSDHPDRAAYDRYEKQWQAWRDQLVQRHTQMKMLADKQRGIVSATADAKPSKVGETKPKPYPVASPAPPKPPCASFGDRVPLLNPSAPMGSKLPQPELRGMPHSADFEDSNSYCGNDDEINEREQHFNDFHGKSQFEDESMEGGPFSTQDRFYNDQDSRFNRPSHHNQFFEDDYGWSESRTGSLGGGFRGRGRNENLNRGMNFNNDREFSNFEGGRDQFGGRFPQMEGEREMMIHRGEGFDAHTGRPIGRGNSTFNQMGQGFSFEDSNGRGGLMAGRGRGNLRGQPMGRGRGFEAMGGPPSRNYRNFNNDNSWDPSMVGGQNFDGDNSMGGLEGESWDSLPGIGCDSNQGHSQNVGHNKPINAFEEQSGPQGAGVKFTSASKQGKIPSLLPMEEIQSLRQATAVSTPKTPGMTSGSTNEKQGTEMERPKQDTKAAVQTTATAKPEQIDKVRQPLLPTPGQPPHKAVKPPDSMKTSATPQVIPEKSEPSSAKQVLQPKSGKVTTPEVQAQLKTPANKEKISDSSCIKEQNTSTNNESPTIAQKPASGGVSLYDDEDFTADVDISDTALGTWQQPDPIEGLQKLGIEALSSTGSTPQSSKKPPQAELPKQAQVVTTKQLQKPVSDALLSNERTTQKASEDWKTQSINDVQRPQPAGLSYPTIQSVPEDFGAKNVFQYDDCYVFMDDDEVMGSEDMDLDEEFDQGNQYYGGYQQQGPSGYDRTESDNNLFGKGHNQLEGIGRGLGRGRGQKEGGGRGQSKGRGRGEPKGRGRGMAEGRGRGMVEGRGRGMAEGRGRGMVEGRGRGMVEGRGRGMAEGRGRGTAEGRGRGTAEGRGRGTAEGRGRGTAVGRGRGTAEGRGRGTAEGRGRGTVEGIGRGLPEGRGRGQLGGMGRGQGRDEFEKSYEQDVREHGQPERCGISERERDQSERGHNQFEDGRSQVSRDHGLSGKGRGTRNSGSPFSSKGEEFQINNAAFINDQRERGMGQDAGIRNTGFGFPRSEFEEDFPIQYDDYMEPLQIREAFREPEPRRNQISQVDSPQQDNRLQKQRSVSPVVKPAGSINEKGSLPPLAIAGTITRALTADEQNIILRAVEELKALQDMKEKAAAPPDNAYIGYGLGRPSTSQLPAPKRPRLRESRWGDFNDETTTPELQQQRGWKEDMFANEDCYAPEGDSVIQDANQKPDNSFAVQDRKQSWDSYDRQGWTEGTISERRNSYGQNPNYIDQRLQSSDARYYDERDKWVGESGLEIDHFASQSRQPDGFCADRETRTEYSLAESRISIDYGHKLSVAAVAQQIPSLEAVVPDLYSILQPPPMPILSNLGLIETIDYAHGQKAISRDDDQSLGDRSRERLSPPIKDREFRDSRVSGRYQDRDIESDKYGYDFGERTSKNWDRDKESERQYPRDRDGDSRDRNREKGDRDRQSGRSRDSDRDYPRRRDDSRERSSSHRDYRSSKDHHSTFPIHSSHRGSSSGAVYSKPTEVKSESVLIEDLLSNESRRTRPPRIVIILRGPPGSGKTFVAKLIKDKEVENGGSAPRMLCLDDYFMLECEKVKKDPETGKKVKIKALEYEYEPEMEESYRGSLFKTFKKTLEDGFFPFIIVDAINEKIKYCEEMWSFAKQKGFQVYIGEMDMDGAACHKRNIHGRSLDEINKMIAKWEATPRHYLKVDVRSLLQDAAITEVHMEDTVEEKEAATEAPDIEILAMLPAAVVPHKDEMAAVALSKWEKMEATEERLDKLDGLRSVKRKRDVPQSLEDYLQLPDDYEQRESQPGKKRVRWADIEEGKDMERRRAVGFVVGQTDWKKLTDPTHAQRALTKTKYI